MAPQRGAFKAGETVVMVDTKERLYLTTLESGGKYSYHGGTVFFDDIIGQDEGLVLNSSHRRPLVVFRPSLAQYVLKMPRGAQVIYPKDLSTIVMAADIFPGAVVFEAGTGSGALTMTLLRAVGSTGRVISEEFREDFAGRAAANIRRLMGEVPNLELRIRDVYAGLDAQDVDRIVLDLPEPWRIVEGVAKALRPGGYFASYLPTVLQVKRLVDTLYHQGEFVLIETVEVLQRHWHVAELSIRPEHRMVAHTGFIIVARKGARFSQRMREADDLSESASELDDA
ncbi:MAG: tRNA (adenine-N1)-methyltransferase [Nitrospinae bacterium]|nr:tRNA (adenine-N1)-methyltransferase [Nitrospinota bacterium]